MPGVKLCWMVFNAVILRYYNVKQKKKINWIQHIKYIILYNLNGKISCLSGSTVYCKTSTLSFLASMNNSPMFSPLKGKTC